jgi:acyl carrier protein
MLLSCRALNRGVEHRMLRALGEKARGLGLGRVDVRFVPTKKNLPAQDFLEGVGAQFREPSGGDGYVFKLPTEVAAAAVYSPSAKETEDAGVDASARPAAPARRARGGGAARGAGLRRIATELHDAEQILQSIELFKRRARAETEQEYVAPRTPIEEMLAEIWSQVLGVDKVGVNDNFFKLGGHSLLAAILMSRVVDTFHAELPLRSFFQAPTIADMSDAIELYQIEHGDGEELAGMMQELETLSDEEVRALLESEARLARDYR